MESSRFERPSPQLVESILAPFRAWFDPTIFGLDKISPDKPALYVCNHTIFGLTDGIFLGAEALLKRDVFIHALTDNMHMQVPVWRDIVGDLGMVPASREACRVLMKNREHIMVFPGGTREICKQKGESYKLIWKNRVGFARMAIENGYDIIPVASLGGEETYKILWDSSDIMNSPIGYWLKKTGLADKYLKGGEHIPPIVSGLAGTILPKPERLFILVGDPIETKRFAGHEDDEAALFELRGEVESILGDMFDALKELRKHEPKEEGWREWLKNL